MPKVVHEFRLQEDSTLANWNKFVGKIPQGRHLRARKEFIVKDGRRKPEIVLFHQTGKEGLLEKMQNWWFAKEQRALARAYVGSISMFKRETGECFKDIHQDGLQGVHAGAVLWIQVEQKQHDAIKKDVAIIKLMLDAILHSISRKEDDGVLQGQLYLLNVFLKNISSERQAPLLAEAMRACMCGLSAREQLQSYTDFIERAGAASLRQALVTDLRKHPSSTFDSPLSLLATLKTTLVVEFEKSVSIRPDELQALPDVDLMRYRKALRSGNLIKPALIFEQEIATRFAARWKQSCSAKSLPRIPLDTLFRYQKLVAENGLSDAALEKVHLLTLEQVDAELLRRAKSLYVEHWKVLLCALKPESGQRLSIDQMTAIMREFFRRTDAICKSHGLRTLFTIYVEKKGKRVVEPALTMRCFHRSMITGQSADTAAQIRALLSPHAEQVEQGGEQFKSVRVMLELLSLEG